MIFIGVSNLQRAMKIYSIWRCTLQITRYFVCVCHTMALLFLLETAIHNGIRKYSNLLHFINVQFRKKNQFFFLEQKKPNDIYIHSYTNNNTQQQREWQWSVCLFIFFSFISSLTSVNLLINAVWCKVTITSCARYCNKSLII